MGTLFKAASAFALAAWLLGTGPFAGPVDPHWDAVRADLAAARPQEKLAAQVQTLFQAGSAGAGLMRSPTANSR